jgi:choline-sulfatase
MHWPQRWAEKNLPSLQRLKGNGLYFNRAYTAACQCSPSRAVMLTSRFAPINRVTRTFLWPGLQHKDRQPNIASLLKDKAGYEVIWKGKWHLSYGVERLAGQRRRGLGAGRHRCNGKELGMGRMEPTRWGNAILGYQPIQFGDFNGNSTLGGANPNNDGRYISGMDPADPNQTPGVAGSKSAIEFLKKRAGKGDKPFCLFVSLVNPHDVYVYPLIRKSVGYDHAAFAISGSISRRTTPTISLPSRACKKRRAIIFGSSLRSTASRLPGNTSTSTHTCTPSSTSRFRRCSIRWRRAASPTTP